MRVPNKILFDTSRYRLGNLSSAMYKANETMTTGKTIQGVGDDPVGLSHVMEMKSSVSSITQLDKNIDVGKNWLDATDVGMESLKDLVSEANLEISKLISGSYNAQQRKDAVGMIDTILRQVVDIGNTRVHGNYIFGGSRMDAPPFVYHEKADPPYVSYEGNDEAFKIRTGENKSVEVGQDGSDVFYTDNVAVNSTNNTLVFQEDKGLGPAFRKTMTLTLPTGAYSGKDLAQEVENRMNALSEEEGYSLDYSVEYDAENQSFSIGERGGDGGFVRTEILWKTGGEPRIENAGVTGNIPPESLDIVIKNLDSISIPTETDTPMRLVWDGEDSFTIKDNPGYVLPAKLTPVDGKISLDLTDDGVTDVEISVDMDTIRFGDSISFSMVDFKGSTSIGREMGFYDVNTSLNPLTGSTRPTYTIDATNLNIDFAETDAQGNRIEVTASLVPGAYHGATALTAEIKAALESASPNHTAYAVTYDAEKNRFFIREDGGTLTDLELLWETGPSAPTTTSVGTSIGATLGFDAQNDVVTYPKSDVSPTLFEITSDNKYLNFKETLGGVASLELTAMIPEGSYDSIADLETVVSDALNLASANGVLYMASYDPDTQKFSIATEDATTNSVTFLWESGTNSNESLGSVLGYEDDADVTLTVGLDHVADEKAVLLRINSQNKSLDFQEVNEQGEAGEVISIDLPDKAYTDPKDLAADIESLMRAASPSGIDYVVAYDEVNNLFSIRGGGEGVGRTRLLWQTGPNSGNSLAQTLGFDPARDATTLFPGSDRSAIHVVVDSGNNKLDFREVLKDGDHEEFCELTATIPAGTYTDMAELAEAVETAMEKESRKKGFEVAYTVNYDEETGKFSIREETDRLDGLDLLFESGANSSLENGGTGEGVAGLLGFADKDFSMGDMESNRDVEWSLFRTLNDLMADLSANDVEGMEQGLQRLETSFDHLNSLHAETGVRYNRLEIQANIHIDMKLSLKERTSNIEDADAIEAIMNLQARELAYQAGMSSTTKIMQVTIMDYL